MSDIASLGLQIDSSQANAAAFDRAVAEVSEAARRLLISLHTHAPARDREAEAEKAKERSKLRFG